MLRPMATRWRWPPESCAGFLFSWLVSPRISAAASTFLWITLGSSLRSVREKAMFS